MSQYTTFGSGHNACNLVLDDNMNVFLDQADLVYADMIYENLDFQWILKYWNILKPNGIFIVQTDYHSSAEVKVFIENMFNVKLLNWLIWKNEFGNFKKDRFRQCHDDILIFNKGPHYKWYPDRIQVPKATAKSKGLNPSGRDTKLATSVITDICLTTVANERVKNGETNLRWQKPIALMDRLFQPFTDGGDTIIDPFLGSGTTAEWCFRNNRRCIGIEKDEGVYHLATQRLKRIQNDQ